MKYFNDQSQRIVEIAEQLVKRGIVPNERTFCMDIDYTQSIFSQIKAGWRGFPKNKYQNITKVYNVSLDYITRGEGSMFINDIPIREPLSITDNSASIPIIHQARSQGVPFYDIDVTASIVSSFSDVKEAPDYYIDFKPFNDCIAWMPIYGDSMNPLFYSGEIIAVKQISNMDVIQWGEPHLVITDHTYSLRTIKCVHPADDTDKIILRATNPNHKGDTVIDIKSILSMYIIKGKVTRFQI